MTNAIARLDAAAVPPTERARLAGDQWALTPAGRAALAAAGPSCDRQPWDSPPCLLDAGHDGACNPRV